MRLHPELAEALRIMLHRLDDALDKIAEGSQVDSLSERTKFMDAKDEVIDWIDKLEDK